MINSFTTSNYSNLKGFLAELICEYHFSKLSYNVIPLGNEKISGLLPSIKTLFKDEIVEEGTYDSNTFKILQGLTQHLPDFAIWKLAHNQDFHSKRVSTKNILKISFIEVKYRKEISSRDFVVEKENDDLSLYKYLSFIESKAKKDNLKIDEVDFYVYLITYDKKNEKHLILFGKVFKNTKKNDSYIVNLYETVNENFNLKTGNKWNNYNSLVNFLSLDNSKKINYIFDENFILSMMNKDESDIRKIVFKKLEEFK